MSVVTMASSRDARHRDAKQQKRLGHQTPGTATTNLRTYSITP